MLVPAFQLHLNTPILEGLVTVGKYDGKHASLTCGTAAGKVFVHCPHDRTLDSLNNLRFLNINRRLTAIVAGALDPSRDRDVLAVGSQTNVLVYDVDANSDLFFRDVQDAASALAMGTVDSMPKPLLFVGGNCSVQGFDATGNESFWAVTGDMVTTLAPIDFNADGVHQLVVGSADYELRFFRGEEMLHESAEADKPTALCSLGPPAFGYALANGTVGVYQRRERAWRARVRGQCTALCAFDIDADGVPELVSGWGSGRVEARRAADGESVFKDHLGAPVSGLVAAVYRGDGVPQLVCAGLDGEIRGYTARPQPSAADLADAARAAEEEQIRELGAKKQALAAELKALEEGLRSVKAGPGVTGVLPGAAAAGTAAAPAVEAKLALAWRTNAAEKRVELVATVPGILLRGAVLFAEQGGVFPQGESLFVQAAAPGPELVIPFAPTRDVSSAVRVRVFGGPRGVQYYSILDGEMTLPRFSMYQQSISPMPLGSHVTLRVPDRADRVALWLQNAFIVKDSVRSGDQVDASFVSLRTGAPLRIRFSGDGELVIATTDMDVAGDLVQDLAQFMALRELPSVAEFAEELAAFEEVVRRVEDYHATRQRMTADMAESAAGVSMLAVRAEEARLRGDMNTFRKAHLALRQMNGSLIAEYSARATNHQQLLDALKEVSAMIQKAAKLRVGAAKNTVVAACRDAVRANDLKRLAAIIRTGTPKIEVFTQMANPSEPVRWKGPWNPVQTSILLELAAALVQQDPSIANSWKQCVWGDRLSDELLSKKNVDCTSKRIQEHIIKLIEDCQKYLQLPAAIRATTKAPPYFDVVSRIFANHPKWKELSAQPSAARAPAGAAAVSTASSTQSLARGDAAAPLSAGLSGSTAAAIAGRAAPSAAAVPLAGSSAPVPARSGPTVGHPSPPTHLPRPPLLASGGRPSPSASDGPISGQKHVRDGDGPGPSDKRTRRRDEEDEEEQAKEEKERTQRVLGVLLQAVSQPRVVQVTLPPPPELITTLGSLAEAVRGQTELLREVLTFLRQEYRRQ